MEPSTSNPSRWDRIVASFPDAHLLQTREWGQVKARFGWEPFYLLWMEEGEEARIFRDPLGTLPEEPAAQAAAMVLQRAIPIRGFAARLRILYIPKGPLLRNWGEATLRASVLRDLKELGRKQGAIFIKIDPDVCLGTGIPSMIASDDAGLGGQVIQEMNQQGWRFSEEQVQFRNTVLLDLTLPEEVLLARMKQKTRYNIRLAARKGVRVRIGAINDLGLLYQMYAETSVRDGFVIRDEAYYRNLWETFIISRQQSPTSDQPYARALLAEVAGEPVAAVWVFVFAGKAWYLFGMSRQAHREKMPNYLLQWEAMRLAKAEGCSVYDLWGAPDDFNESDPLWSVYRFKAGLGGEVVRHIGAWDLPLRPVYYQIYTQVIPRLLNLMRNRGKERVRQTIGI